MQVGVSNVGTHSFSFSVEGRLSPDVVAFTASLTQVCVSPDTREVMEVPAQLRASSHRETFWLFVAALATAGRTLRAACR